MNEFQGSPKQIYIATDDNPLSRQEICDAALKSGLFPNSSMPKVKYA